MAKRKAAFQMSLGFIVAVVFAVVLLTLTVTWVQQLFGEIGGLTDDLTEDARNTLQQQFDDGSSNFGVSPNYRTLKPGTTLKLSTGIKNDAGDGDSHTFVINVVPAATSNNVCDDEELMCRPPQGTDSKYSTIADYMQSWVTWTKAPVNIDINNYRLWDLTINVPNNVVKGEYLFFVVGCYEKDNEGNSVPNVLSSSCQPTSKNLWGGSSRQLTIVVES